MKLIDLRRKQQSKESKERKKENSGSRCFSLSLLFFRFPNLAMIFPFSFFFENVFFDNDSDAWMIV